MNSDKRMTVTWLKSLGILSPLPTGKNYRWQAGSCLPIPWVVFSYFSGPEVGCCYWFWDCFQAVI
jgi:hypothetical protein